MLVAISWHSLSQPQPVLAAKLGPPKANGQLEINCLGTPAIGQPKTPRHVPGPPPHGGATFSHANAHMGMHDHGGPKGGTLLHCAAQAI